MRLINHKQIYRRFQGETEEARAIYSALITYLGNDPWFKVPLIRRRFVKG